MGKGMENTGRMNIKYDKEMGYVKKGLTHQVLVVSIIDKNKASLCVLCPVMLHRELSEDVPQWGRRTKRGRKRKSKC